VYPRIVVLANKLVEWKIQTLNQSEQGAVCVYASSTSFNVCSLPDQMLRVRNATYGGIQTSTPIAGRNDDGLAVFLAQWIQDIIPECSQVVDNLKRWQIVNAQRTCLRAAQELGKLEEILHYLLNL
jgi:hypothetical protein